jgi:hypothetical protein
VSKPELPFDKAEEIKRAWEKRLTLPPDERAEYEDALKRAYARVMQEYDPPTDELISEKKLAGAVLDAIDYGAGVLRTPVVHGIQLTTEKGRKDLRQNMAQDWKDALIPFEGRPAPGVGTGRHRAGYGDGPPLSTFLPYAEPGSDHHWARPERGGLFDFTPGGSFDFMADAAISPAALAGVVRGTAKRLGAKAAAEKTAGTLRREARDALLRRQNPTGADKIARAGQIVADPLGEAAHALGAPLHKSALPSGIDDAADALIANNVPAIRPSELLLEEEIAGSPARVAQQAAARQADLAQSATGMERGFVAQRPGVDVPLRDVKKKAMDRLRRNMGIPRRAEVAGDVVDEMKGHFKVYKDAGIKRVNPVQLGELSRSMQEGAAELQAYKLGPNRPRRGKNAARNAEETKQLGAAYADVGQRARREVEDLFDDPVVGAPGAGGDYWRNNQKLGALISANPYLTDWATKGRRWLGDAGAGAAMMGLSGLGYMTQQNPWAMGALAAGGLVAGSRRLRSNLGSFLHHNGRGAASAARAGLVEKYDPFYREPSPWTLMKQEMDDEQEKAR